MIVNSEKVVRRDKYGDCRSHILVKCDYCKRELYRRKTQADKSKNHFCCKNCQNKHQDNKVHVACA